MSWETVTIILMHYVPRSKGARVIVMRGNRHIVSSASHEGLTVDDPDIQRFLEWARGYYDGAAFREITREQAEAAYTDALPPKRKRGRSARRGSTA